MIFGALVIPFFISHTYTVQVLQSNTVWLILLVALVGTLSYVFYYTAINTIGPIRAMGGNITYVAWAIFIDVVFVGGEFSFVNMLLAAFIVIGSIITVTENKKKKGYDLNESNHTGSRIRNKVAPINK